MWEGVCVCVLCGVPKESRILCNVRYCPTLFVLLFRCVPPLFTHTHTYTQLLNPITLVVVPRHYVVLCKINETQTRPSTPFPWIAII